MVVRSGIMKCVYLPPLYLFTFIYYLCYNYLHITNTLDIVDYISPEMSLSFWVQYLLFNSNRFCWCVFSLLFHLLCQCKPVSHDNEALWIEFELIPWRLANRRTSGRSWGSSGRTGSREWDQGCGCSAGQQAAVQDDRHPDWHIGGEKVSDWFILFYWLKDLSNSLMLRLVRVSVWRCNLSCQHSFSRFAFKGRLN